MGLNLEETPATWRKLTQKYIIVLGEKKSSLPPRNAAEGQRDSGGPASPDVSKLEDCAQVCWHPIHNKCTLKPTQEAGPACLCVKSALAKLKSASNQTSINK